MVFAWNDEKRLANLERHRLDFVDARLLFDGRSIISYQSMRGDENRFVTIGRIGSKFYAVVWVERSDSLRLISFRRARDVEDHADHAEIG